MPLDLAAYNLNGTALFRMALLQEMLDHCSDPALALVVAREAEGWLAGDVQAAAEVFAPHVLREAIRPIVADLVAHHLEAARPNMTAMPRRIDEGAEPAAPPQVKEPPVSPEAETTIYLTPCETDFFVAIQRHCGDRLFNAQDASDASGKPKNSTAAELSILVRKGAIHRPRFGVFTVSAETARIAVQAERKTREPKAVPRFMQKQATASAPAAPSEIKAASVPALPGPSLAKKRVEHDPLADIVAWMISIGEDIQPEDDIYMLNGRIRMSPETLIEAANKRRRGYGLPLYSLERVA